MIAAHEKSYLPFFPVGHFLRIGLPLSFFFSENFIFLEWQDLWKMFFSLQSIFFLLIFFLFQDGILLPVFLLFSWTDREAKVPPSNLLYPPI